VMPSSILTPIAWNVTGCYLYLVDSCCLTGEQIALQAKTG
jgi:hypothetical protein